MSHARKKRRRRRGNNVLWYFLFLLLLTVGLIVAAAVFFRVKYIDVRTETNLYTSEEITEASGIRLEESLFTLNKEKYAGNIEKKLPYIEHAVIRVQYPATVKIDITVANPAGVLKAGDDFYLISDKAKVLGKVDPADDLIKNSSLPILVFGDIPKPETGQKMQFPDDTVEQIYFQLRSILQQNGVTQLTQIDMTSRLKMKITWEDRLEITLGSQLELEKKLKKLKKMCTENILPSEHGTIDATDAEYISFLKNN